MIQQFSISDEHELLSNGKLVQAKDEHNYLPLAEEVALLEMRVTPPSSLVELSSAGPPSGISDKPDLISGRLGSYDVCDTEEEVSEQESSVLLLEKKRKVKGR